MTDTYDKAKAKALFDRHIQPAHKERTSNVAFLNPNCGPTTHYLITPEMLRTIRGHLWCGYRQRKLTPIALNEHLAALDGGTWPEWDRFITPDPKPAWRVKVEQMYAGVLYGTILDAVEKALEETK